jgi:gibberellin A4 carboxyl methyltransferase
MDRDGTTRGMVGGGFYDAHSAFQADVAASGTALLEAAIAALTLPANRAALLADYGCSEGRNSLALIAQALDLLQRRGAKNFTVLHNDLPTNDWNRLAANLGGPDSYLAGFPASRALFAPRGFFERVTEPGTVVLGTSGSAAHWLSQQPAGLDMPGSLYRSDAPATERDKILAQAAADWQRFLAARAEELRPGGVLLVQMLGTDAAAEPPRVSAAGLLGLMNTLFLQLIEEGAVPRDIYARYCFPVVPRTVEEACAPVLGPLADRLELLHAGLTPIASPYDAALDATGDVAAFARNYTAFTRAFSESSLTEGMFRHGTGDPKALADVFFARMEQALAADPQAYPFDDLTLAVLVRRRP